MVYAVARGGSMEGSGGGAAGGEEEEEELFRIVQARGAIRGPTRCEVGRGEADGGDM